MDHRCSSRSGRYVIGATPDGKPALVDRQSPVFVQPITFCPFCGEKLPNTDTCIGDGIHGSAAEQIAAAINKVPLRVTVTNAAPRSRLHHFRAWLAGKVAP